MKRNLIGLFSFVITLLISNSMINAQNTINPEKGYSPQVGVLVSMLEDMKNRVERTAGNLNQEDTDFLLDENANSAGALVLHLAATEKYYQVYTFENRGYNSEENEMWDTPMNLGDRAREELKGKPISYYFEIWDDVRKETLRLLKTKDDDWLASRVQSGNMNNHWAWYHVMEHQSSHLGQILFLKKRM